MKCYADRDHMAQGEHYVRHVSAMTGENLHAKSAIAAELAHRDIEIERLRAALEVSQAATNAAVSKAQFQASTNAELNALHDKVRRLQKDACSRLNDEFGA